MDAFSPCHQMLAALASHEISASELLKLHLARIDRCDGPLNSIIVRLDDQAQKDASAADALLMSSDESALASKPLLGLPITVKESIDVAGTDSTAGVPERVGHPLVHDSRSVQKLRAAGAIVIGKTNVCPYLADYIADNPVYGRTVSPWDPTRTPGGSSGGSASIAAGLAPLDLGTDMGGSIRIPAAFCGLWGHKPSEGAVPYSGHFPGSALPNAAWIMTAQGAITRSAGDLELALRVLAGPDVGMDAAWQLHLPPPRRQRLREFRIAALPWFEWLPVDGEIVAATESLLDRLRAAGAAVKTVVPPGLGDYRDYYRLTRKMMSALVSSRWPADRRRAVADDRRRRGSLSHEADAAGFTASASDLLVWHGEREQYRQAYREFFQDFDVLLTPISLVPPFEHPTLPVVDRQFEIDGKRVDFDCLSFYPGVASLVGHGAVAFPIGVTRAGLPLGAQAIGPFLEDYTPIHFAQTMERELGGFIKPRRFDSELR
jgi:amidase